MSVILDALRRGRRSERDSIRPSARQRDTSRVRVPSGLGLGSSPLVPRPSAIGRWVVVGAVLAIAVVLIVAIDLVQRSDPRNAPRTTAPSTPPRPTSTPRPLPPASVEPAPTAPRPEVPAPVSTPAVSKPEARVPPPVVNHFDRAVGAHMAGNLDEAARQYLAAIANDDRSVEAHNNLGLLYRSQGLRNEAIEQFTRALAIDLRYVKARNHLAVMLIESGRLAEARTEIALGLSIDPRNVDLLVNEALVEKADRHPERAIELLLRALGEQPTHAAAHYNLALLYDERQSPSLAYSHYTDFITYAGPEYRAVVADVRQRAQAIGPAANAAPVPAK